MTNQQNNSYASRHAGRYYRAMASDYFREQEKKRSRLVVDICAFFLLGVLFLLLAEIVTAQEQGRSVAEIVAELERRAPERLEQYRRERKGVWVDRQPDPLHIIVEGTVTHREEALVDRMFPAATPPPYFNHQTPVYIEGRRR